MDDADFWKLIDASRLEAGGDVEEQVAVLTRELGRMPVEEIVSYENHFVHYLDEAYDERLWAAGYILDELGDDDFSDFRAWLVLRGRDPVFLYSRLLMPKMLIWQNTTQRVN